MSNTHKKLIILGSGPAGYAASIYAARAGLNPALITGTEVGGQLTTTTEVENWPGDSDDLQGPELMERMQKHALKFDVEIINDHIHETNLTDEIKTLNGNSSWTCDALIIATGASAKYLVYPQRKDFLVRVYLHAQHVMASSIKIKKLRLLVAEILPLRKRFIYREYAQKFI